MDFFEKVKAWFQSVWQKTKDGCKHLLDKIKGLFKKKDGTELKEKKAPKEKDGEKSLFEIICIWVFRLRGIFMAIPVVWAAIVLAVENMAKLPAKIAFYIPTSQHQLLTSKLMEFSRETAVYFPLAVTGVCLALMFCSRRATYPWLISIFTLVLPLFFRFISTFPG